MASYTVTTYSAKRDITVDAHFQCTRCGFSSPVRVPGHGDVRGKGSSQQAASGAESAAHNDALACFELLRCPSCNTRSAQGDKREQRAKFPLLASIPLAVVVLIGLVLAEVSDPYTDLRTVTVLLLVGAVPAFAAAFVVGLARRAKLPKETNSRVAFALAARPAAVGMHGAPMAHPAR